MYQEVCKKTKITILLVLFIAIASAGLKAVQPENEFPRLIPREVLFQNPAKTLPKISPDGKSVAYLAPSDQGVLNVWIGKIGSNEDIMITNDEHRGIRNYFWSQDGTKILHLQDSDGDENYHVFITDIDNKMTRDLTPFPGKKAVNLIIGENEILVGLNLRNPGLFDIYRINLENGALVMEEENPGNVVFLLGQEWIADSNLNIRAARGMDLKNGGYILMVKDEKWRELFKWPWDGSLTDGYIAGLTKDGEGLYILSSLGFDKVNLVKIDAATGKQLDVIAGDDKADLWIEDIIIDPESRKIQAYAINYMVKEWKIIDESLRADFKILSKTAPGFFNVISRDRENRKWIVSYEVDDGPVSYYIYDRVKKEAVFLFDDRPGLREYKLAEKKSVIIKSRDGLDLVSYLTLPVGVVAKNLPMILYIHGGPTARDDWSYDPVVQMLANRGYAVLQVNFRGSVGFGKKFQNAGDGQIGVGSMQNDLTDAVKWAIKEGYADPEKIAAIGGSYGGYATLAGLTFTPDLYACGVAECGPTNIKTLLESIPPYWGPLKKMMVRIFGDAENDDAYNQKVSPLFHVDKIKVPVMIAQGANDPRNKMVESDQIVKAMLQKNIPVTYVVYTDEGHGFIRPENKMDFWGRVDEFFGKNLGGRYEPFKEVKGSSAELK